MQIATMIKQFLPNTLFGRSLLIIVTPIVLAQVIATYVFYERHWESVGLRLAASVAGDVATVIDGLENFHNPDDQAQLLEMAGDNMGLQVTFFPGDELAKPPPVHRYVTRFTSLDRHLNQALAEQIDQPFYIDAYSTDERVEINIQLAEGVLRAIVRDKRVFSNTTYIFILWMVGSALALLAVAIIFLRNQMRPIRQLAKAAESFGKGREVANFRPSGATEVRQASRSFLEMRDRIIRQINQRTEMLAGVSHDLRTPLTRMKLQLAMLGESEEIENLKSDVVDMERMVDGYLAFARGQDQEAAVQTDLPELLRDVVADALRHGGNIELDVAGDITVPVRPNAFRRCITNLLENARRHADSVLVRARQLPESIEIAIEDDGPGIPENEREAVFRPFHRLDESRNQDTGGSGLGLSIAMDVARWHGGDITLGDAPAGGLKATVRLPV